MLNNAVMLFENEFSTVVSDYTTVLGTYWKSGVKSVYKYILNNLERENNAELLVDISRFLHLNIRELKEFPRGYPDYVFCRLLEQLHFTDTNILFIEVIVNKLLLMEDDGYMHVPLYCFEPYSEFRVTSRLVGNGFYKNMQKYFNDNFLHVRGGE